LLAFGSVLKEYTDLKLLKDFLEFKNIILKEKLSNKFKNGYEKFLPRKASDKSLNFMVLG
jgi:hypothetical protein